MDRYGLIGHPVGHSLSPKLFNAAYGGRWEYDLIDEEDFGKAFRIFIDGPYRAVNVTAPHKRAAAKAAGILSPEVRALEAANILVKTSDGIKAFNSDFLGLKYLLPEGSGRTAAVIGLGGAGLAALAAAKDLGYDTSALHHDELAGGVEADLIIYTLPKAAEGIDKLECDTLVEANYLNPCLKTHKGYVPGEMWLLAQAVTGFPIMTGEQADSEAMRSAIMRYIGII